MLNVFLVLEVLEGDNEEYTGMEPLVEILLTLQCLHMFGYRIGRRIPLVIYFLIGGAALLSTLPIVLTGM